MVVILVEEDAGPCLSLPQVEVGVGVAGFQGDGEVRLLNQGEGVVAGMAALCDCRVAITGPSTVDGTVGGDCLATSLARAQGSCQVEGICKSALLPIGCLRGRIPPPP